MSGRNCLSSKTSQWYAPFTFILGCMKITPVHTAWRHRLKLTCRNMFITNQWQWGMSMSWNGIWLNVVSKQHSFTDQAINQWRDYVNACLKDKSKHFEHLLLCFSVTVMTSKAYITAVMNKLTCLVSQGRVRTAVRRVWQCWCIFVAKLL